MNASGTIEIAGYTFDIYANDTNFKDVGAVYIFMQLPRNLLYIGQTESLEQRIPNHEKWSCVTNHGVTGIAVHQDENANSRLVKETEIRNAYPDTPCNDQ